jgi:hypothetical protein
MDDLDLPPDRANLFEILGLFGFRHLVELFEWGFNQAKCA